jgi:hypothetical protein
VQHVVLRSRVNILTLLIMNYLMTQGGLKEEECGSKLVSFGVDGVNTFQGLDLGLHFKSNVNMFHSS